MCQGGMCLAATTEEAATSVCGMPAFVRPANASHWRGCCFARATATVYNTLHQFTEAGMLRVLAVQGARTYFDTNTSNHLHYFIEGANRVFDIAPGPITVLNLPDAPAGMEIVNVDVVVRLRPKRG